MSFRFLDQVPQFLTTTGEVLAGGTLTFSLSGTSTPQATYSDMALTTLNANPVPLDASGKPSTDIWMSGNYRVVIADSLGAVQWTRDNVQAPNALPSPTGNAGKFIGTDGSAYLFQSVLGVPSVTGVADGWVLTKSGTGAVWAAATGPGGALNGAGANLTDWVLEDVRDKVQTITAAGTLAIDFTLGGIVILNQAVAITALTIASVTGATLTIHRVKDATGTAYAITWPSNVKWSPSGTAPTLTSTANACDIISLQCADGTNWHGTYSLDSR